MSLLFIRHAETDMAGTFCGHLDIDINQLGLRQIELSLEALHGYRIDSIYTSDLKRAASTARAIAEQFHLSPIPLVSLREIHFGDWEGLTWSELEQKDPVYAQQWIDSYPNLPAPNGETFAAFETRVLTRVNALLTIKDRRCIAVVTHAGVMRVVLKSLCGVSEAESWSMTRPYCSFFEYPLKPISEVTQ